MTLNQPRPVQMFMYNNFNVHVFYSSLATWGLNRIMYLFTEALNARHHLSQYVLIVPDKDMITKLLKDYQFNASITMGRSIFLPDEQNGTTGWAEKAVDCAIHKLDLGDIKLLPRKYQQQGSSNKQLKQTSKPRSEFLKKVAEIHHRKMKSSSRSPPKARKRLYYSPSNSHRESLSNHRRSRSRSRQHSPGGKLRSKISKHRHHRH